MGSSNAIKDYKDVMLCVIWYYLCNLKNVKNTHGGVLLLVKLQAKVYNFNKINTPPWVFSRFFNCIDDTKLHKASQVIFVPSKIKIVKFYTEPFLVCFITVVVLLDSCINVNLCK